ncbi:MAG: VIT domain-containing protein [Ferruginibacter sp.]
MRAKILSSAITIILLFSLEIASAQSPQLTVDGKTNNGVVLQNLQIEIKLCGTVAKTSWKMVFINNTAGTLEGTLNFPLKDGLSVSRYALDINGKMREAVPVDRGKGAMVFEAIERRRVDPGLLEKVEGNTFRTRIYPINAHSTRTVIIGYEEELPIMENDLLRFYMPLSLKDTIADFSLDIEVIQSATQPFFDTTLADDLHFDKRNNLYKASLHKTNYSPVHSLSFSIPKPLDATEVMLQEFENKYYYLINTTLEKNEQEKQLPQNITLLWDASLSGTNRNIKTETALLDAYFKKVNSAGILLLVFSNKIYSTKKYTLQNGNWNELKQAIDSIQYDGATNLGCLQLARLPGDEFLLMSDGRQTFGSTDIQPGSKPVYCITSAANADYSSLKYIALKTGGALIDQQKDDLTASLKKLIMVPFHFMGILQNNDVEENYPSLPVTVSNSFSAAGIAAQTLKEIILQFGYGNKITLTKKITIRPDEQLCENFDITKVFAQKKITELDIHYDENKQAIERLGKRFGIVTRNTSLIVLETVNDYLQYNIEPPAELRNEYDHMMKQRGREITKKKEDNLKSALEMMEELKTWWGTVKKPAVQAAKKPIAPTRQAIRFVTDSNQVNSIISPDQTMRQDDRKLEEAVVVGYASQNKREISGREQVISAYNLAPVQQAAISNQLQGKVAGVQVTGTTGSAGAGANIRLRGDGSMAGTAAIDPPFNRKASDYIKIIKATAKTGRYEKYLELRKYYMASPVYFFEVAGYFLKTGDKETGLKILSNLAELETGSYELYKMLGYKLKETGDYEGEMIAFKKLVELRPLDPQSYRDYALALDDAGRHQDALNQLYEGLTKSYSEEMRDIYDGIEEIFLLEINRLVTLHPKLRLKEIPKSLIQSMPVDLRIVMNWNMNNTDIDLWVTDPNEEKCMYTHTATDIGGRISDDFTEDFGPEQFILKNSLKGKYRIEINYFGDTQVTLAGPTTVMAEIYLHYGMPNEEKRIVILQMDKGKTGAVFIGEVTL